MFEEEIRKCINEAAEHWPGWDRVAWAMGRGKSSSASWNCGGASGAGGAGGGGAPPFPPFGAFPWNLFRRARAKRGDVRAAILSLLSEKPLNGYQIMQELEQRSRGSWRPRTPRFPTAGERRRFRLPRRSSRSPPEAGRPPGSQPAVDIVSARSRGPDVHREHLRRSPTA